MVASQPFADMMANIAHCADRLLTASHFTFLEVSCLQRQIAIEVIIARPFSHRIDERTLAISCTNPLMAWSHSTPTGAMCSSTISWLHHEDGFGDAQVSVVVGRKPLCQGVSDWRRGTASIV